MKENIPISYLLMIVAGKQVIIEAMKFDPKVIRELRDGTKQQPHHTAVVIVNNEFVCFL